MKTHLYTPKTHSEICSLKDFFEKAHDDLWSTDLKDDRTKVQLRILGSLKSCGTPTDWGKYRCGLCPDCSAIYWEKHKRAIKSLSTGTHLTITLQARHFECSLKERREIAQEALSEVFGGVLMGGVIFQQYASSNLMPDVHFHILLNVKGVLKRRRKDLIDVAGGLKEIRASLTTIWTGMCGEDRPELVHVEFAKDFEACASYGVRGAFDGLKFEDGKMLSSEGDELNVWRAGLMTRESVMGTIRNKKRHFLFGYYANNKRSRDVREFLESGKLIMEKPKKRRIGFVVSLTTVFSIGA